jgi:uncharacterized membrane protein YdbT with pleckstrin-like domain
MKTELKNNEEVFLIIKKHWFVIVGPIFWTLILLLIYYSSDSDFFLIGAGLTFIWFFYKILVRNSNLWIVTNLRVIDEYGVFSNNSKETPVDKINNVSFKQPLLGRVFNYGHVQIQSAAESGSTVHKMVESPKLLKDTITECQELYKQEQIEEQAKSLANAVIEKKRENSTDISEELTKLFNLKEKGIITEEDFQKRKEKILNE